MSANVIEHRKDTSSRAAPGRRVLVGTYKGDQLSKWRGWYNYPVSDEDFSHVEHAERVDGERGNGRARSPSAPPKPHGDRYALFKTQFMYCHEDAVPEDAERVIIRIKDFARSPKVRKQLKAYLESPDRKDPDLAKRLPEIIVKLRPDQLRVCESTVQIELFSWDKLQPVHLPKQGEFTAVELFAGAGGLSIGLERAGIHAVIANEIMPDFAATLAANHPEANMANKDTCRFKEVA